MFNLIYILINCCFVSRPKSFQVIFRMFYYQTLSQSAINAGRKNQFQITYNPLQALCQNCYFSLAWDGAALVKIEIRKLEFEPGPFVDNKLKH